MNEQYGQESFDHIAIPAQQNSLPKRTEPRPIRRNLKDHTSDRASHVAKLQSSLSAVQQAAIHAKDALPEAARASQLIAVAASSDDEHPIPIDLLSKKGEIFQYLPAMDEPSVADEPASVEGDRAVIFLSETEVATLKQNIDQFLEDGPTGRPKREALFANLLEFRPAVLSDLWVGDPSLLDDRETIRTWELWYLVSERPEWPSVEHLRAFAASLGLVVHGQTIQVGDYVACLVDGTPADLELLLASNAVPVEVRRPSFIEELHEMGDDFVHDWVEELSRWIIPAGSDAPVVTVLDNGVRASHPLLAASLGGRVWSVIDGVPGDDFLTRHGTLMSGIALYGDLRSVLEIGPDTPHSMSHALESVRVLRSSSDKHVSKRTPSLLTVNAVSTAEVSNPGQTRVFLLAQTITGAEEQVQSKSIPTIWSTTLDALAMGCFVEVDSDGAVVGVPEPGAQRLFCVSIGNVPRSDLEDFGRNPELFPSVNLTRVAEEPSQAWNVLRVGAYTELASMPASKDYDGWAPISEEGGLSPHSRTGVVSNSKHSAVPDIVLEGGNLLRSPAGDIDQPVALSVVTTSPDSASPLSQAIATSSASAQAARLCALVHARYPDYWPETVRGLLVHRARWTEAMSREVYGARFGTKMTKGEFDRNILRCFGWGVPREELILNSGPSDVTLVVQDELLPLDEDFRLGQVKFYDIPWTKDVIESLGSDIVELRVTLSYFVEPNPGKRGKESHTSYPSHGLQYLIKSGTQSSAEFRSDIAGSASDSDKSDSKMFSSGSGWVSGPANRDRGSIRSDVWHGAAHRLIGVDEIAIVPLTGWWKLHGRASRLKFPVRYSLLVTLRSLGRQVDIYSDISQSIGLDVENHTTANSFGQLELDIEV